jgi:hypothetical protein
VDNEYQTSYHEYYYFHHLTSEMGNPRTSFGAGLWVVPEERVAIIHVPAGLHCCRASKAFSARSLQGCVRDVEGHEVVGGRRSEGAFRAVDVYGRGVRCYVRITAESNRHKYDTSQHHMIPYTFYTTWVCGGMSPLLSRPPPGTTMTMCAPSPQLPRSIGPRYCIGWKTRHKITAPSVYSARRRRANTIILLTPHSSLLTPHFPRFYTHPVKHYNNLVSGSKAHLSPSNSRGVSRRAALVACYQYLWRYWTCRL